MAARKLQAEMDRTFKKIQEGVENFEDVESKMNAAGTPAQKEKLEADLKTQIKKLQRLRDQLKTWQAGSDVKDKAPIIEHRRLIEVQMERFKMIEKEMKTKAYSTVGLVSHSKLDPREQHRLDLIQWLQGKVEELQQQVETAEAELETLQAGAKKKGKAQEAGLARAELLESQNERRDWHISQLEIILRLVENSSLKTEAVEKIKEDVDFFVGSNTEEDFEYDDGVYADLDLDKYIEADLDNESTVASDVETDDLPTRTAPRKSSKMEEEDSREDISKKAATITRPRARSSAKATEASIPKPAVAAPNYVQPMASVVKAGTTKPPTLPPLRYSAAAAMGTSTAPAPAPATIVPASNVPPTPAVAAPLPRALTPPPVVSPVPAVALPPTTSNNTTTSGSAPTLPPPPATTPPSKGATPGSDHQVTPVSPSELAVSSAVVSPMASPVAMREREPSVGGLGHTTGSYGGAPSAPSVTSMSIASPVVSLVEAAGASPSVSRMNPTPFTSEPTPSVQQNPQYTLQGILPQQQQQQPHPGHALNGLREAGNTSTMAMKPGGNAAVSRNPVVPPGISPGDELAVGPSAHNGAGAIGPGYGAPSSSISPGLSANGHEDRNQNAGQGQQPKFAATLSDLMSSFKSVGLKAPERMRDSEQVKDVLDIMSPSMPQPRDAERPKYHTTRNPLATPSYYPQQMLPLLASPEFFERLDVETLFWVFYYMPGTYQQWLAAQELKKQSWRFHVKFLTWFQRHAKPDEVTDEYEQGQYLYFDWEGSWCVRKKSDFRFEYRNLSDD